MVAGAGLDSWCKTGSHWIGGNWYSTGSCCCRKVVAGSGLVAAGAGRWSLVQGSGRLCRTGSCCCRKVVAGAGLVVAGTISEGIRLGFQN